MKDLITKKNWIRIRHYFGKEDKYSIQLGNLGKIQKDYLWWWANAELEEGIKPNDWPNSVYIDIMNMNRIITTGLNEIINDELLDESEKVNIDGLGIKRLNENKLHYIEEPSQFLEASEFFDHLQN
jgi:hypothetical protein